jgi:hypothetical protein
MDMTQILMIAVLIVLAVVIYTTMINTGNDSTSSASTENFEPEKFEPEKFEPEKFEPEKFKPEILKKIKREQFTPAPADVKKQQDILSKEVEDKLQGSFERPGTVPPNMLVPDNAFNYDSNVANIENDNNITGWDGENTNIKDADSEVINLDGERVSDNIDNPYNESSKEYRDLSRKLTTEETAYLDNEVLTLPGTDALAATQKAMYAIDSLSTVNKNSSTDLRGEPNIQHDPNFFAPFNSSSLWNNNYEPRIESGRL